MNFDICHSFSGRKIDFLAQYFSREKMCRTHDTAQVKAQQDLFNRFVHAGYVSAYRLLQQYIRSDDLNGSHACREQRECVLRLHNK